MSRPRRGKEEGYQRHYTVTDPRAHPKGYTEYKVTARFVSKANPEDVKEIVVWKRYTDFKKLHGDLAYIHRNLFRRLEDFPTFPKAQVFGRFEPEVIEERRKAAEVVLHFTVNIPALNNSPQLKEFFRGGEVRRPLETPDLPSLPPPLIPVPSEGVEAAEDALGSLTEEDLLEPKPDQCSATKEGQGTGQDPDAEERATEVASLPLKYDDDEAFDVLFAFDGDDERIAGKGVGSPPRCLLSVQELALFDPFSKEASDPDTHSHGEELAALAAAAASIQGLVPPALGPRLAPEGTSGPDPGQYLQLATECIRLALEKEAARDYQGAFQGYRSGVDLLLQGLQGDPDPVRREAVKKKTSEYLQRAEEIFQQHLKHLL